MQIKRYNSVRFILESDEVVIIDKAIDIMKKVKERIRIADMPLNEKDVDNAMKLMLEIVKGNELKEPKAI